MMYYLNAPNRHQSPRGTTPEHQSHTARAAGIRALMVVSVLVATWPAGISAQFFDCEKTSNATESLICSDPELLALDKKLSGLFQKAVDRTGAVERLESSQRLWMTRERDACHRLKDKLARPPQDVRECVRDTYWRRMWVLEWYAETGGTFPQKGLSETLVVPALKQLNPVLSSLPTDSEAHKRQCRGVMEAVLFGQGVELVPPTLETRDWYDPELQRYVKDCPQRRFVGLADDLGWRPNLRHEIRWPQYAFWRLPQGSGEALYLLYSGAGLDFPPYGDIDGQSAAGGKADQEMYLRHYRKRYGRWVRGYGDLVQDDIEPYWLTGRKPMPREVRGSGNIVEIKAEGCEVSRWAVSAPRPTTLERVVHVVRQGTAVFGLFASSPQLRGDKDAYWPNAVDEPFIPPMRATEIRPNGSLGTNCSYHFH